MSSESMFITRDLYLAASLVNKGFELDRIDFQLEGDRQVGYFCFAKTPELEETERSYWKDKGGDRDLFGAMRALKARVASTYKLS